MGITTSGFALSSLPGISWAFDSTSTDNRKKASAIWESWENKHGNFQQYLVSKPEQEQKTTWELGCQFQDGSVEFITYSTSDYEEFTINMAGKTFKETVTESDRKNMEQELASKTPHHDKEEKRGEN